MGIGKHLGVTREIAMSNFIAQQWITLDL